LLVELELGSRRTQVTGTRELVTSTDFLERMHDLAACAFIRVDSQKFQLRTPWCVPVGTHSHTTCN
jgi:hypothetical protein